MPIDDFVTRGINPFTKEPLEFLDAERLVAIRDDPARVYLKSHDAGGARGTKKGSRFGGRPLLPTKTRWPKGPKGPLTFIGQIDFEQLAAAHKGALPLPRSGVLGFFYDVDNQAWGERPGDSRFWKLVYVPDVAAAELTKNGSDKSVPLRVLQPTFAKAQSKRNAGHQVWGPPTWIQHEARLQVQLRVNDLDPFDLNALRAAEKRGVDVVGIAQRSGEWRLLWQIDSDLDLFAWGDVGSLYLLIRQEDLDALRFEKAWCILQCH